MQCNARCWKRRLTVLAIATSLLSGCATDGSDGSGQGTCPPVVDYGRGFQARAAEELALLPEGSAVAEMLVHYAVMREQVSLCSGSGNGAPMTSSSFGEQMTALTNQPRLIVFNARQTEPKSKQSPL